MVSQLHLPSLIIEGFRGIRSLNVNDLGRVTLLAGKNGVGKTTVLEAIRVFASRGNNRTILDLLDTREEFVSGTDADGDAIYFPDYGSLFHNYNSDEGHEALPSIRISAARRPHSLSLSLVEAKEAMKAEGLLFDDLDSKEILVSAGKYKRTLPVGPVGYYRRARRQFLPVRQRGSHNPDHWPEPIVVQSLGPGLAENDRIAEIWDGLALTDAENFVVNALRLATGEMLQRLAVVGDSSGINPRHRRHGRHVVAKLSSLSHTVPLKRLGDGAQRLLGIALALANCQNGILLIDEIENGIHYSVLPKLWDMIFTAAQEGNIQVVAATHSWDCVASFARSANRPPMKRER